MRSLEGQTLGSYRLIEPVGHGGMAVVYRAFDPNLDRSVAIKFLPQHLGLDKGFAARFRHEARQVAKLSHPYIMPIFAYGEENGLAYFVMEFVEGGTLKNLMASP
jgi:serine/threonine-protein kinase